jgi:phosphoglucosamine mutase
MSTKPELFGTDGIRGVAGEYPLDPATIAKIGGALGAVLKDGAMPVRVVLGKDTRESKDWISRALASGLAVSGAEVLDVGVITTPGVAYLTKRDSFSAGVMVSASHNPYQDNGIKVFSPAGTKLPLERELQIEARIKTMHDAPAIREDAARSVPVCVDEYVEYLVSMIPPGVDLSRFRLVVDCANGSASRIAPLLLSRLGIAARLLNAEPNGKNINLNCGSLHPEGLVEAMGAAGADLGVAFDGDADRAIFVTSAGRIADGDHVLYAIAPFFDRLGSLKGRAVVGTLMTNLALELALAEQKIGLKRTSVGDKYVLEEMLKSGISLGGEASGHIIFSDLSLAGDGMITLLEVLRLLATSGQSFDELLRRYQPFPQLIRNVRVREKPPLEAIPSVAKAITDCCLKLGERGRVVVRYSGTEPLARVMVEGEDAAVVEKHTTLIATAIKTAVGLEI